MKFKIIDDKFKENKSKYVIQCIIATLALIFVLVYVDLVFQAAVVTSLGATSFIIFTMPHKNRAKARYIIGGYTIGISIGFIFTLLVEKHILLTTPMLGAMAVGICMFIMVITNTEHPPAAGLALAIVIEGFDLKTVSFVYLVSILLIVIKHYTKQWLIDLL